MDREKLTVILAQILTSDEKWQQEVERNVLLQKTIDSLFSDPVFQVLLENEVLPKFNDTHLPHYRAIELICTFRELSAQIAEGVLSMNNIERELEDLQLKVCRDWDAADSFELELTEQEAIAEARRFAELYDEDRQFAARLDRFRLIAAPVDSGETGDSRRCRVLLLENVRPPRNQWSRR